MSLPMILLTRPQAQARRFATQIQQTLPQAEIRIAPVMRIVAMQDLPQVTGYDAVVFTSENAVRVMADRVAPGQVAYCVGDRTAKAAQDLGLVAHSAKGSAADLLPMLRQSAARRLIYLHGRHRRLDLAAQLPDHEIAQHVVYDQIAQPLDDAAKAVLAGRDPVILPLFSPRSAEILTAEVTGVTAPLWVLALSPQVANAWTGPHFGPVTVAPHPDHANMIRCIATIWANAKA